jgi:hypothetical protein
MKSGHGRQRPVERHEVREGLVEHEAHPVRIDHGDLAHLLLEDAGALDPVEAELHVLGGKRITVVELEPFAQLELVDALIGAHGP